MMEGYFVLFQVTLVLLHRNEDPRYPRFWKSCCADVRMFLFEMCVLTERLFMPHISHGCTKGLISFVLLFQVSVPAYASLLGRSPCG